MTDLVVTKQRAREIITAAGDLAEQRFGVRAAWDAYLGQAMTAEERTAVTRVWRTMPGHYSFARTITRIARGR